MASLSMTQRLGRIKIVGVLSMLPCAYFWVGAVAGLVSKIQFPYDPGVVVLCVALSIPASVLAAIRWTRWMYAVTAVAVLTLVVVMGSLG
jgi:hypothetical protein